MVNQVLLTAKEAREISDKQVARVEPICYLIVNKVKLACLSGDTELTLFWTSDITDKKLRDTENEQIKHFLEELGYAIDMNECRIRIRW